MKEFNLENWRELTEEQIAKLPVHQRHFLAAAILATEAYRVTQKLGIPPEAAVQGLANGVSMAHVAFMDVISQGRASEVDAIVRNLVDSAGEGGQS